MKFNKRFILAAGIAVVSFMVSNAAFATTYTATGTPVFLQAASQYATPEDNFEISGFTSAGNCYKDHSSGNVVLNIHKMADGTDGGRLWALALAAIQMGRTVTVMIDDSIPPTANGGCYIVWMYMN